VLRDGSGSIECSWPGQPFLDRSVKQGDLLLVTGPVRIYHKKQIQPREYVVLGRADETESGGKVLPIYPATEGLSQKMLRMIVDQNLERLLPLLPAEETMPQDRLRTAGLPTLMQAVAWLHRPETLEQAERGRRRLAYDESFFLQLLHARARYRATAATPGIAFKRSNAHIAPLYRALPFELTGAQTRAIAEIFADMTSARRMNRLLQGDVGSGKTIVALFAMLLAAETGYQSALMAPTEILAEQHARTLSTLLDGLPIEVVTLTGRMGIAERRDVLAKIATGAAHVTVGTHALIQEGVAFHRLGLVVIDEQHRFGVRQRLALAAQPSADRAGEPDVLVMSATPIPRSLALTLYGDLDLTVLDELPPTRRPVRTTLYREEDRARAHEFIREQAAAGRQAYIVYPLIDESEKVELRAAAVEFDRLVADVFHDLRVGLLHGQISADEKESTMRAFVAGDIDVLVATTVIEVGIDVPNATVMVVEHADRFGLSQLHQLRGRVGRGAAESHCILIAPGSPEAVARLRILAQTQDGFEIARADLHLRGMGDFFGARQHGLPDFRFFDVTRDEDLLALARDHAEAIIAEDPDLEGVEQRRLRETLSVRYAERERLYDVG
jgi:ATP-dependent DNA helicase RecG